MRLGSRLSVTRPDGRKPGNRRDLRTAVLPWLPVSCALLGGRAFGMSGIVAMGLAWPLAGWWDESAGDTRAWASLLAAGVGAWWGAGTRPAVVLVILGAVALGARMLWRSRLRTGWAMLGLVAAAVSVGDRAWPSWSIAAGIAVAQGALLPLGVFACRAFLSRCERILQPSAERGVSLRLVAEVCAAGACAAGLAGLPPQAVDLRAVVVGALVLWTPVEAGGGAAVGALAAWMAALTGGVGIIAPAAAALGGALAGAMGRWRRQAAPAGLAVGALLAIGLGNAGLSWGVGTLGIAAVAAVAAWWRPRAITGEERTLAAAWREQNLDWLERLRACARACLELSRGLAHASSPTLVTAADDREGLRVAEEVCPGCPSLRACWERRLPRARHMVANLWSAAVAGGAQWQEVGGPETVYCLRPREMAEVANRHAALLRQREELGRLLTASRRSAVAPLLGIGRMLGELVEEAAAAVEPGSSAMPEVKAAARLAQECWRAAAGPQCWGYAAAAVAATRPARAISGDVYRCRLLPDDRLALVLGDGMGSGPLAAAAAAAAAELLLAWLTAGEPPEHALRRTNDRLLQDGDGERFATIDLMVVDLRIGMAESYKMGAAPSFLYHGRGMREIMGGGLPAGILNASEIRSARTRLRPGDVLIMVTDGVLDVVRAEVTAASQANGRGRWAADWMRAHAIGLQDMDGSPIAIARGLGQTCLRIADGDHDDLTIITAATFAAERPDGGGH